MGGVADLLAFHVFSVCMYVLHFVDTSLKYKHLENNYNKELYLLL